SRSAGFGTTKVTGLVTAGLFVTTLWNLKFFICYFEMPAKVPRSTIPLTVLLWDWPSHRTLNLSGDICADLYSIQGCQLTDDRGLFDQADVVVFHHQELQQGRTNFPKKRSVPLQKWVWVNLESPTHTRALAGWKNIFNWVMTYRQDSDIFIPYGKLMLHSSTSVDIPDKTGLVSWVISNYHHSQKRAQAYKNLSRHLHMDIFGKASKRPLCETCLLATTSQYKFYLAFENSIHQDYITEKLWRNALLAGTVPVVLGPPRANYEKFIPADSFIHVEDFGSMQELASFIKSMNASHYRQFFEWKKTHKVKLYDDWRERFCTICTRYHTLPKEKLYPDLETWFRT
uniref:Fucosyltransferase n=1 Tax=Crocodylus porosus TaxID=8502 RepID=A0A7M4FY70_CROPO